VANGKQSNNSAIVVGVLIPVAVLLIGAGVTAWFAILGHTAPAKVSASLAIALGVCFALVAWRFHRRDQRPKVLASRLEALAIREESAGGTSTNPGNHHYVYSEIREMRHQAHDLAKAALVDHEILAELDIAWLGGLIDSRSKGEGGLAPAQAGARSQAVYIRGLLKKVKELKLMPDWEP
jgi:hypothetical protein